MKWLKEKRFQKSGKSIQLLASSSQKRTWGINMTLREVCDDADVSRRAIQGYEKAGLISASGKNERGYLLYDMAALERVKQIK